MQGPAEKLETDRNWKDYPMHLNTGFQLNEIVNWWESREKLKKEFGKSICFRRGLLLLFQGPSGTGKKTAAAVLGKRLDLPVYRIDLSRLVSNYIGETEKNLGLVLDKLERKTLILFFDEADALFGKRTPVGDGHDRYANQEVAYLLKRLDNYSGIVIFSSRGKINVEAELRRRFHRCLDFQQEQSYEGREDS